jgi:ABC-type transport system substrate-binding protein
MGGYHNDHFDHLATSADTEMEFTARRQIILEMQKIIIDDVPYIPLYVPNLIEAVRTDRFQGWVPMLDGIGNRWSFNEIKPNPSQPGA